MLFVDGLFLAAMLILGGEHGGMEKRSHFALRISILGLVLPCALLVPVGALELHALPEQAAKTMFLLLFLADIPALMFIPALLFRSSQPPSGPTDGDDDGGSGPPPPRRPDIPGGGLPLPDADAGRWRVRDHGRPRLRAARPRRCVREPERRPAHTPG